MTQINRSVLYDLPFGCDWNQLDIPVPSWLFDLGIQSWDDLMEADPEEVSRLFEQANGHSIEKLIESLSEKGYLP